MEVVVDSGSVHVRLSKPITTAKLKQKNGRKRLQANSNCHKFYRLQVHI